MLIHCVEETKKRGERSYVRLSHLILAVWRYNNIKGIDNEAQDGGKPQGKANNRTLRIRIVLADKIFILIMVSYRIQQKSRFILLYFVLFLTLRKLSKLMMFLSRVASFMLNSSCVSPQLIFHLSFFKLKKHPGINWNSFSGSNRARITY